MPSVGDIYFFPGMSRHMVDAIYWRGRIPLMIVHSEPTTDPMKNKAKPASKGKNVYWVMDTKFKVKKVS